MDGDELQEHARARVQELPGAELEHPFGPDWEVYKVRGRVFMLLTDRGEESIAILKVDPEDSKALREQHADITPGYHMNKKHWITLHPGGELRKPLLDDLVTDSYLLVVENLPRAKRPVDPALFGGAPPDTTGRQNSGQRKSSTSSPQAARSGPSRSATRVSCRSTTRVCLSSPCRNPSRPNAQRNAKPPSQFCTGRPRTQVDVCQQRVRLELGGQPGRFCCVRGRGGLEPVTLEQIAHQDAQGALILDNEHPSSALSPHVVTLVEPVGAEPWVRGTLAREHRKIPLVAYSHWCTCA